MLYKMTALNRLLKRRTHSFYSPAVLNPAGRLQGPPCLYVPGDIMWFESR